jgi:hypothetical protein
MPLLPYVEFCEIDEYLQTVGLRIEVSFGPMHVSEVALLRRKGEGAGGKVSSLKALCINELKIKNICSGMTQEYIEHLRKAIRTICLSIQASGFGRLFFGLFWPPLCCAAPYEKLITNFRWLRPII